MSGIDRLSVESSSSESKSIYLREIATWISHTQSYISLQGDMSGKGMIYRKWRWYIKISHDKHAKSLKHSTMRLRMLTYYLLILQRYLFLRSLGSGMNTSSPKVYPASHIGVIYMVFHTGISRYRNIIQNLRSSRERNITQYQVLRKIRLIYRIWYINLHITDT